MAEASEAGSSETKQKSVARKRRYARLARRTLLLLAAAGAAVLLVVSLMPKPVVVETAPVLRGPLEVTIDEDGLSRVKDRHVVSAPISGNLGRIELSPGDAVKQGDVLARIVPLEAPLLDEPSRRAARASVAAAAAGLRQAKAQIERAETALAAARADAKRDKMLFERGATSPAAAERAELEVRAREAELTSAQFAARVAEHEYEMAKAALGLRDGPRTDDQQLVVPSPITGRVLKVLKESEGAVQTGTPLIEVGDPTALEIVVDVLTSDAVRIQPGAPVSIERWGGPPLSGHVRLVEPSAFTRLSSLGVEEQRVNAIIDIDDPYEKWAALGDGYRVETKTTVYVAESALKIPTSALFRHEGDWAVFVAEGEAAHLRQVKVIERSGFEAQIESGVEPGEKVIVHPSDRVTDGAPIRTR